MRSKAEAGTSARGRGMEGECEDVRSDRSRDGMDGDHWFGFLSWILVREAWMARVYAAASSWPTRDIRPYWPFDLGC